VPHARRRVRRREGRYTGGCKERVKYETLLGLSLSGGTVAQGFSFKSGLE
jgi:hypothetical protein